MIQPVTPSEARLSERSMFGPPGSVYVYLSYGVHVLLNLVCDRESVGSAVLVRSFEPLGDVSVLRANRERARRRPTRARPAGWLSCGPGRVGQALGLELDLDGLNLGKHRVFTSSMTGAALDCEGPRGWA